MIEPQTGTWYIVVTCKSCDSVIFLFRIYSGGNGSLNATYRVTVSTTGRIWRPTLWA